MPTTPTEYTSIYTAAEIDAAVGAVPNKQNKVTNINDYGGVSLADHVVFNVNSEIKGISLSHLKKMLTSEYNYNNQFGNATFNYYISTSGASYGPRYNNIDYGGKTLLGVRLNVSRIGYGKVVIVHNVTSDATVTTTDKTTYNFYVGQVGIQDIFLESEVLLSATDVVMYGSDETKEESERAKFRYAGTTATGCMAGFSSYQTSGDLKPKVSSTGFIGLDLIVKEADSVVTIYSGSSAPSSATGNDGDIYIQTS